MYYSIEVNLYMFLIHEEQFLFLEEKGFVSGSTLNCLGTYVIIERVCVSIVNKRQVSLQTLLLSLTERTV